MGKIVTNTGIKTRGLVTQGVIYFILKGHQRQYISATEEKRVITGVIPVQEELEEYTSL